MAAPKRATETIAREGNPLHGQILLVARQEASWLARLVDAGFDRKRPATECFGPIFERITG